MAPQGRVPLPQEVVGEVRPAPPEPPNGSPDLLPALHFELPSEEDLLQDFSHHAPGEAVGALQYPNRLAEDDSVEEDRLARVGEEVTITAPGFRGRFAGPEVEETGRDVVIRLRRD